MNADTAKPTSSVGHSNDPEPILDRKQKFAQRASVSPRTVDNWLHNKIIPHIRIGRAVLIPWREALEHLRRNYGITPRGK